MRYRVKTFIAKSKQITPMVNPLSKASVRQTDKIFQAQNNVANL